MRYLTVESDSPTSLLHSEADSLFPWKSIIFVVALLWDCWWYVAHRQFSGEYGPAGSGYRSRLWSFDGLIPMSLRKARKSFSHRSQTVIPFPPYRGQLICNGSLHRLSIPRQIEYSVVLLEKCIRLLQPQLMDLPVFRLFHATIFSRPHLHRQCQYVSPQLDGASPITVQ